MPSDADPIPPTLPDAALEPTRFHVRAWDELSADAKPAPLVVNGGGEGLLCGALLSSSSLDEPG